jgi:TolB-like protein/Tfp pilus assembly protein PilF
MEPPQDEHHPGDRDESAGSSLGRLLEELKRRRVVRVAIVYAIALFGVLQVADIVIPALHLPDALMTGIVVVGALGFPLAMALAWAVDVTPHGLERTRSAPKGDATSRAPVRTNVFRSALLLAAAVVVVAGSVWWTTRPRGASAASAADIRSLAVLPLANLMGDESDRPFVDGMQDILIGELSRIDGLSVISQRSVLRYRDSDLPIGTIAGELGVDAVIEGSVFRQDDSVRVSARLIRAEPETDLWNDAYEGRLSEAMTLQSRVARAVAGEIQIALSDETAAHMARRDSVDPEAMDAYLLGRELWKSRDPNRLGPALEQLEKAVAIDSTFALGWAGVADGYIMGSGYRALDIPRDEAVARAQAAIGRAEELDPGLMEAHAARGALLLYLRQDYRGAVDELSRVVELSPSYAQGYDWLADALYGLGRLDEALERLADATRLDPLSALMHRDYARAFANAGRCDRAEPEARRALELDPNHFFAFDVLRICALRSGRDEEALEYDARSLEMSGSLDRADQIRDAYETGGMRAVHLAAARQFAEQDLQVLAALRYGEADAADSAFAALDRALENRDSLLLLVRQDPALESLHADPRWNGVLRRLEALGGRD